MGNGFEKLTIDVPTALLRRRGQNGGWLRTTTRNFAPSDDVVGGAFYIATDLDTSLSGSMYQFLCIEGVAEFSGQIFASDQLTQHPEKGLSAPSDFVSVVQDDTLSVSHSRGVLENKTPPSVTPGKLLRSTQR